MIILCFLIVIVVLVYVIEVPARLGRTNGGPGEQHCYCGLDIVITLCDCYNAIGSI